MARKTRSEALTGIVPGYMQGPMNTVGYGPQFPQAPMPQYNPGIFPGDPLLPYARVQEGLRQGNTSKTNESTSEETRIALDPEVEAELRGRMAATPEYQDIMAKQMAESQAAQNFIKYLKETAPLQQKLRMGQTLGRGIASITGDKSYAQILPEALTPEQLAADESRVLNEESQRALVPQRLLAEYIKNNTLGKVKYNIGSAQEAKVDLDQKLDKTNILPSSLRPRATGGSEVKLTSDQLKNVRAMGSADYEQVAKQFKKLNNLIPNFDDPKAVDPVPGYQNEITWSNWVPDKWSLGGLSRTKEGNMVRGLVEQLAAPQRHSLYGAALTKQELENWNLQFGDLLTDNSTTSAMVRSKIKQFQSEVESGLKRLENPDAIGKLDPRLRAEVMEIRNEYIRRTGKTPLQHYRESLYGEGSDKTSTIPKENKKEVQKSLIQQKRDEAAKAAGLKK